MFRIAAVLLAGVCLAGCTGGHRLGVPRTLETGDLAHHVSVDLRRYVYGVGCDEAASTSCNADERIVPSAAYGLRYGIAPRVELGASIATTTAIDVDVKLQLVRSHVFDAAVVPTVGFVPASRFDYDTGNDPAATAMLPLLLGVNVGPATIVPGGAVGLAWSSGERFATWAASLSTFFRVKPDVAVGPGVTVVPEFVDASEAGVRVVGGLTVAFGSLPRYD